MTHRRDAASDLTETVVASRLIHRGHLEFRVDEIVRADGSRGTREIVGHPGAVTILAIDDDDRVVLVRQYRLAAGQALLELPAGTLDVDPVTGAIEDPAQAAPRELEEETGYRADAIVHLADFWTAPGFATELMRLYLATGLHRALGEVRAADEDERLEVVSVPVERALAMADRGEIADAKSLVGLLWLARQRTTRGAQ